MIPPNPLTSEGQALEQIHDALQREQQREHENARFLAEFYALLLHRNVSPPQEAPKYGSWWEKLLAWLGIA